MAHDFNNLLSSIFGSINLLKKGESGREDFGRLIDNIENCSIRARDFSQAVTDIIAGRISVWLATLGGHLGNIQAGKVRALAVLSAQRERAVPNVPTAKEAGVANFEVPIWYGILAPAGTPRDIINRLNLELNKVVTTPDVRERLTTAGVEPITSTPEQFANFIKSETARYAKVIKDAGIKPE